MNFYKLIVLASFLSSCATFQTKVNSELTNSAFGFQYHFPRTGDWYVSQSNPGNIVIGKKSENEGQSLVASVKSGPIGVTKAELDEYNKTGKKIKMNSESDIINSFRKNIENDAKLGRVENIQTKFSEKKYDLGSCLIFSQTGEDAGAMPISNDGKWCFNRRTYSYIMLNISARMAAGKKLPDLTSEKSEFFDSLVFTEK